MLVLGQRDDQQRRGRRGRVSRAVVVHTQPLGGLHAERTARAGPRRAQYSQFQLKSTRRDVQWGAEFGDEARRWERGWCVGWDERGGGVRGWGDALDSGVNHLDLICTLDAFDLLISMD